METKKDKKGQKTQKGEFSGLFAFSHFLSFFVSTLISLKEADFRADFRSGHRVNETRMARIERIDADTSGFICDDPRSSASSAFY